ncbi:hypothetical protein UR09_06470, partial [Candidatus Nitromaritima sp. SCGC AAA799-A02]
CSATGLGILAYKLKELIIVEVGYLSSKKTSFAPPSSGFRTGGNPLCSEWRFSRGESRLFLQNKDNYAILNRSNPLT